MARMFCPHGTHAGARRTVAWYPSDRAARDVNISVVITTVSVSRRGMWEAAPTYSAARGQRAARGLQALIKTCAAAVKASDVNISAIITTVSMTRTPNRCMPLMLRRRNCGVQS